MNPLAVEGQLDGQVFSGMGQVLYEECKMEDGLMMNPSRLEYKLPRTYELPDVDYILVETIDPYGPFGAKEVGEGPIVVSMSAIASAVANAIGAFVPEIPMTPWKVLRMLRAKDRGAISFDKSWRGHRIEASLSGIPALAMFVHPWTVALGHPRCSSIMEAKKERPGVGPLRGRMS